MIALSKQAASPPERNSSMNRIVTMVLKNLGMVPGAWFKLCKYANHTDDYPEIEKYRHIQYI